MYNIVSRSFHGCHPSLIEFKRRLSSGAAERGTPEVLLSQPTVQSARRYDALFADSALFLVALTMDGYVERVGESALEPFGFEPRAALGHRFEEGPWWRKSSPGTRARLRAAIARASEQGAGRVLGTLVSSGGEERDIDMMIDAVGRGEEAFLLLIGTDVTAERQKRRERDQERCRARNVFAASGIVAWRIDVATRRVVAEPEFAWLYGLPCDDDSALLDRYLARVHHDDLRRVSRALERTMSDGEPLVSTHRAHGADGTVQWLISRGEAERDSAGKVSHVTGIVLDITSEHAAVEALEANEARYRRLFESVQEGFCVLDPIRDEAGHVVDACYAEVNPAFECQSGLSDVEGRRVREVLPELEAVWMERVVRVIETGEPLHCTDYSGDLDRWVEIGLSRIDGSDGVRVGCLFRDVTKAKRGEKRLRELTRQLSEEGDRKSAFLATLAHELRNPLAPVRHGLELLRGAAADEREQLRVMMERQITHTTRLVNDLLDISRMTHDKFVLHEREGLVDELLEEALDACRPLLQQRRHTLKVSSSEPGTRLLADPARVAQVLSSLLDNAARYTSEGGHVDVAVERDERGLRFIVSDDGEGLDEASRERVFEMFVQLRGVGTGNPGGLGLGLTLARRIAEMHGGALEASSAGHGRGSTFTFSLPLERVFEGGMARPAKAGDVAAGASAAPARALLADVASHPGAPRRPPRAPAGRRLKVLVVDDNHDAADTLARVLRARGLDAATAYAGVDALERAERDRFDALVLDIGMPDISGREVARRYRESGGSAILVALTGWGTDDDIARSFASGFDHHLTKPATARAVVELLEGAAGRPEAPGPRD